MVNNFSFVFQVISKVGVTGGRFCVEGAGRANELSVITKAKDLCGYVMTVTLKSPKHFRFTLVAKLRAYALAGIENLYRANEVYVAPGSPEAAKRKDYQRQAMTEFGLLGYMAQLAMDENCILPKQYEQIIKQLYDCRNLLGAWMKSDDRRRG